MVNLFVRIKKRVAYTVSSFQSDARFSVWYALLRIFHELGGRIGFRKLSDWAYKMKSQWISDYLRTNLQPVLDVYVNDGDAGSYQENTPIWVCWWTGAETAPALVKQCIRSIRANAGNHPVHVIDRDNYLQFLEIPEYMLEKVSSGKMGLAHLADYIRVVLIAQHGGLWLDATICCADVIPEEYFEIPLFTCRNRLESSSYFSKMQWTTFALAGWKGNVFFRCLKTAFEDYWQHQEAAVDYLFFDYLIALIRDHIPVANKLLEQVPPNNPHRDDLQAAMNATLGAEKWHEVVQPDTVFYKLSWRETYAKDTADGEESIYAYFLRKAFDVLDREDRK